MHSRAISIPYPKYPLLILSNNLCKQRTISSQGGSIWSIAANPSSSSLALGCEDGTVRILSVAHDTLTHLRRFDRVKCRMLSIAWGPPVPRQSQRTPQKNLGEESSDEEDEDEDDWTDSWLVTGGSDSSLRKWDLATGRVTERMGVDKVRGERTLVWTVGVLGFDLFLSLSSQNAYCSANVFSDGTIISGDSLGMVKFWDPRTCTQLHSFQAHGADVLCMAISPVCIPSPLPRRFLIHVASIGRQSRLHCRRRPKNYPILPRQNLQHRKRPILLPMDTDMFAAHALTRRARTRHLATLHALTRVL